MDEDLYELLEVSPRASAEVVRAAYRRLARVYHPDGESPDAARMVRLNRAFEVLGEPSARAAYDQAQAWDTPREGTDGTADVPVWRTAFPFPDVEEAAPTLRSRVLPWALGVSALMVVFLGGVLGVSRLVRDDGSATAPVATAEARATASAVDLPVPVGAGAAATPGSTRPPAGAPIDLGPVASEIPGTPLAVGSSVRSAIDKDTKPRDVYAVTLAAGQEIRFALTELTSPISAWVDTAVVNPGARDLADSRSFTQALARTTYAQDEWRFTAAIAGTYYLVVRARTSAQAYAFTLTATR